MTNVGIQQFPYSSSPDTNGAVDLDQLYSREAYITCLDEFLSEQDTYKALAYWLTQQEDMSALAGTRSVTSIIERTISEIDEYINDQLNEIIHSEKFQKLESSWRGLSYLATQIDGTLNTRLKVLDISWAEIVKDISRSLEFDQSILFSKIYSEEYGTPGGEPYGALIGDYSISHKPSVKHPYDDVATLEGISQIAAAAFCPFIAGASAELFGLNDFSDLGRPVDLRTILNQKEYIKWRALRKKPDSRFVGLTVPRILMRLPYRKTPGSYKGIYFYEKVDIEDNSRYLWGNASYAFGAVLIREYANVGWFGHIRGVPRNYFGGGMVTSLPVDSYSTDKSEMSYKPVTDVIITDAMEKDLSESGLIPLCQCHDTPYAAFYNNQSIQLPQTSDSRNFNINARLSSMLQHVLCASRIAHYIKVMIRDKVGSFVTAEKCEDYLRDWLFRYTTGREDLEWEEQARYPLREAAVNVKEHPEKPGQFLCVIHLRPHYQLDHMISELELITELSQAGH